MSLTPVARRFRSCRAPGNRVEDAHEQESHRDRTDARTFVRDADNDDREGHRGSDRPSERAHAPSVRSPRTGPGSRIILVNRRVCPSLSFRITSQPISGAEPGTEIQRGSLRR